MIQILIYILIIIGFIFLGISIYYFLKNDVRSVIFDIKSQAVEMPAPKETVRVRELIEESEIEDSGFIEEEDSFDDSYQETELLDEEAPESDETKLLESNETELLENDETELLEQDETELLESEETALLAGDETELLEAERLRNEETELLNDETELL